MRLEDWHIGAGCHFFATHVPVNAFNRSPWQAHFLCYHFPHSLLETAFKVSIEER
jgi:hypothetical protein